MHNMTSVKIPKVAMKASSIVSKKKDEGVYDLEQQFILRLPPGPAIALRRDVQSAAMNLKDRLSIEIQHDMRHGRVTYGGQVYNAKLVDLPCIVESLKTIDKKTFYKTADISQMLRCTLDDDSDGYEELDTQKKKDKEKWIHGITAPLKNVRKRRFRKTLKKKYQEQPDIEKEVKRLFRMDNEAIDVKWEVVIEDDKQNNPDNPDKQVLAQGGVTSEELVAGVGGELPEGASMMDYADYMVAHVFGELSSSDEDIDKDINVMDSDEAEQSAVMAPLDQMAMLAMSDSNTSTDAGDGEGELRIKLEELARQLEEIQEKRMSQQLELEMADMDSKEDLQNSLAELAEEEEKRKNEFEILSSMLNQS